jgi:hypothetical protein
VTAAKLLVLKIPPSFLGQEMILQLRYARTQLYVGVSAFPGAFDDFASYRSANHNPCMWMALLPGVQGGYVSWDAPALWMLVRRSKRESYMLHRGQRFHPPVVFSVSDLPQRLLVSKDAQIQGWYPDDLFFGSTWGCEANIVSTQLSPMESGTGCLA